MSPTKDWVLASISHAREDALVRANVPQSVSKSGPATNPTGKGISYTLCPRIGKIPFWLRLGLIKLTGLRQSVELLRFRSA